MGLLHVLCNNPLVVETHSGLSLEPNIEFAGKFLNMLQKLVAAYRRQQSLFLSLSFMV